MVGVHFCCAVAIVYTTYRPSRTLRRNTDTQYRHGHRHDTRHRHDTPYVRLARTPARTLARHQTAARHQIHTAATDTGTTPNTYSRHEHRHDTRYVYRAQARNTDTEPAPERSFALVSAAHEPSDRRA